MAFDVAYCYNGRVDLGSGILGSGILDSGILDSGSDSGILVEIHREVEYPLYPVLPPDLIVAP